MRHEAEDEIEQCEIWDDGWDGEIKYGENVDMEKRYIWLYG